MLEIYKGQIKSATDKKKELEAVLSNIPAEFISADKFLTALENGKLFFKNPSILWKNGNISQKRKIVELVFTEKPKYDLQNGFLTAPTRQIFNKNTAFASGESSLAARPDINANRIIAEVLSIVEILDDCDLALYRSKIPSLSDSADLSDNLSHTHLEPEYKNIEPKGV